MFNVLESVMERVFEFKGVLVGLEKFLQLVGIAVFVTGVIVSFGSDSPGTNASRYYLNPMLGLYSAVTRKTLTGVPESGWFPNERLTIQEAIRAYTYNTAYASFEDHIKGSLEPGKLADIVASLPCFL